ncbi:MAG: hypothetical protein AB7P69_16610 [Candidatus Binatia bacterium]
MARFFTFIAALWAVVLSAPLCVSGIAAHPCETCAAVCSHEAACSQDPCSLKASQNETTNTLSLHVHLDAVSLLHTWLTPVACAFSLQEKAWRDAALFPYNAQRYPMGAFPLLI